MADILCTVRFGARAISRPFRQFLGSTVTATIEFVDQATDQPAVGVSGVSLSVQKPDGGVVVYAQGELTATATGWTRAITLDVLGSYVVRATCTAPQPEAGEAGLVCVATAADLGEPPPVVFLPTASTERRSIRDFGVVGDGRDEGVAIQAALDAGVPLYVPAGDYRSSVSLLFSSGLDILGEDNRRSVFKPHVSMPAATMFFDTKVVSATGQRLCIAPRFRNLGFDGSTRFYPLWLSRADLTPVTDPINDYLAGGVLAPTTIATINVTGISGGVITGLSLGLAGSGYVRTPHVIIEGDGMGAQATVTMSGGIITAVTLRDGGRNYTTATARVLGGGAEPSPTLVNANRRNAAFSVGGGVIRLRGCDAPEVRDCYFTGHGGTVIWDQGCKDALIEGCFFEKGGQQDFVGSAFWTQSYGTPGLGQAFYIESLNPRFIGNTVRDWNRSALTWNPPQGGQILNNLFDSFGESCIFMSAPGETLIQGNRFRGGRLTDIVCQGIEITKSAKAVVVKGNQFDDIDGYCVSAYAGKCIIEGNIFRNTPSYTLTAAPYGPFSERCAGSLSGVPIAGTQRGTMGVLRVQDQDSDPGNSPNGVLIYGNVFIDTRASASAPTTLIRFLKGAANSIKNVQILNNDCTGHAAMAAGAAQLYDATEVADVVDPASIFLAQSNVGIVAGGGGSISGTTAIYDYTAGFSLDVLALHPWANTVEIEAVGPGGGGGGGARVTVGTAASGGAAGGGGHRDSVTLTRSDLTGPIVGTFGTAGGGGAGATVAGNAGADGTGGTATTLTIGGTNILVLQGGGGGAGGGPARNSGGGGGAGRLGAGGNGSAATAGTAGTLGGVAGGTLSTSPFGGSGGAGGTNGAAGTVGPNSGGGAPGGGSGGGIDAAGVAYAGGNNSRGPNTTTRAGGSNTGGSPPAGELAPGSLPGTSGAGGGGNPSGNGGNGAAGAAGAGGGGGGSAIGGNGGAGGAGGTSRVRVIVRA